MHIMLFFLAVVATEVAEQPADPPFSSLSLTEAQRIGLQHNWDLLAAKSSINMAEAERIIARQIPNPEVSFGVSNINVDGQSNATEKPLGSGQVALEDTAGPAIPSTRNDFWHRSYETTMAVTQVIELGGKRRFRMKAGQAGKEQAEALFLDAQRLFANGVLKAYGDVLLADENARIQGDSRDAMRKEADLAAIRHKAGDISVTELKQIEVSAEQMEADVAAAENTSKTARIALLTLLGIPCDNAGWKPTDSLDTLAGQPAPIATDGNDRCRPDLAAAEAALRKAEAEIKGQKSLRIPDPAVSLSYSHEPPDSPHTIGIDVSVPIPAWHRYGGEIRSAMVARDDAIREIARIKALVKSERITAETNYAHAAAQWRKYREETTPKSSEVTRNISYAYSKGGATLLDLLSARRTDNEIRLATAQAAADTLSALADYAMALNVEFPQESEKPQ